MFSDFVKRYENDDTPTGDFARDWKRKPMPIEPKRWGDLESFLRGNRACDEALQVAETVWIAWLLFGKQPIAPSASPD